MDLTQKKKNRFLFLNRLYEKTNGNTNALVSTWDISNDLNIENEEVNRIVGYLKGETLLEQEVKNGISSTHLGVKEVEQALENPDKPTNHFLPINIINIGIMNNSTLQQATHNSVINAQYETQKSNDLNQILDSLKTIQDTLNLSIEIHKRVNKRNSNFRNSKAISKTKGNYCQ